MKMATCFRLVTVASIARVATSFARPGAGKLLLVNTRHGLAPNLPSSTYPLHHIHYASFSTSRNTYTPVGREDMEGILEDYEGGGRELSGYVVLDVRNIDEVEATGKLSPNVHTLPLPEVPGAFALGEEEFESSFGFEKPTPDETLVFTCLAGKRAEMAADVASKAGYSKLVVYRGGAKDWFA